MDCIDDKHALRRNSSRAMIHISQCVEEQKYANGKKNNEICQCISNYL